MKKKVGKHFGSFLMILLSVSLMLAGCQDSSSTPSGSNPSPQEQSGQQEPSGGSETVSEQKVTIGAGSQGGVYYPVAVGIADVVTKFSGGITMTPEVTGASLENTVLLGSGEVEFGIVTADDIVAASKGEPPFQETYDNISVLYVGAKPGAVQIITLQDSDIQSVPDLKGKRIGVGPQGGSGWKAFAALLSYYDMTMDDINPSYISYGESIEQLTDGLLDATVITAGVPTPAITELAVKTPYKFIPIEPEILDQLLNDYRYYTRVKVSKDLYKGMEADIDTFATVNVVAVRDDVDEELVYNVMKTLFDNLEELKKAHPSLQTLSLEFAASFKGYRYHSGSVKFFKEKGLDVPAQ